jgi:hypothetical protein
MVKLLWQIIDWKWYWWCYMISNLNAMSLITWKEVSIDLFRKFIIDMLRLWHKPDSWKIWTSWPKRSIPRWRDNIWDEFTVEQIKLFSAKYWINVIRGYPMVISINVWDQFRLDREDGTLVDYDFTDTIKNWHSTVQVWFKIYDSRRDQKTYSFTREYIKNVKWLFKSTIVLLFKRK